MITLSKSGNSVTFTFDENSGYLQNGTIDVPVNSLALITDESDMATFRKSASNDIFVSARYEEFGMSKAELEAWYKANMVGSTGGGGGVTSGEVQTMIDESISGLTEEELRIASTGDVVIQWSSSASTNFPAGCTKIVVSNPVPDYYHSLEFYDASGNSLGDYSIRYYWGSWTIENGFNGSSYTKSGETLTITWSADKGVASLYDRENGTAYTVTAVDIVTETPLKDVVEDKLDTSVFEVYSGGVATALSGKQDQLSAGRAISITNNTVAFDLPISAGTGTNSIAEGYRTVASGNYGSHAEGDEANALGNASHAEGWASRATSNYAHAEGIKTSATTYSSHAEGYMTKTSGNYAHAEGDHTTASGADSHAEGKSTVAAGYASHAEGGSTQTKNLNEHASGRFNVSLSGSSTFGDSGNTLFSVGNGTADNARHNALEVRQNGDIYITSGNTDIKLQDYIGIDASSAITSGDTNAVAGGAVYSKFDEVEQVTARALIDVNDKFDGLRLKKLTQAQYDALSGSTDSNTVYFIVN